MQPVAVTVYEEYNEFYWCYLPAVRVPGQLQVHAHLRGFAELRWAMTGPQEREEGASGERSACRPASSSSVSQPPCHLPHRGDVPNRLLFGFSPPSGRRPAGGRREIGNAEVRVFPRPRSTGARVPRHALAPGPGETWREAVTSAAPSSVRARCPPYIVRGR